MLVVRDVVSHDKHAADAPLFGDGTGDRIGTREEGRGSQDASRDSLRRHRCRPRAGTVPGARQLRGSTEPPCYTDPVANLTLSIDDDLLQRAREVAVGERTSVNAVVRDFLTRYVDARSRRLAALDALDVVAAGISSSSAPGWTREELHERSG